MIWEPKASRFPRVRGGPIVELGLPPFLPFRRMRARKARDEVEPNRFRIGAKPLKVTLAEVAIAGCPGSRSGLENG